MKSSIWDYITQKYINPEEHPPTLTLLDMYVFDEIMKELAPTLYLGKDTDNIIK